MSFISKVGRPHLGGVAHLFNTSSGGLKRTREESPLLEERVFHLFHQLFAELQTEVFLQLPPDDPTRYSLALTCEQYYHQWFRPHQFNPYHFADGCAVFGYENLLTYAVESGGPLDHQTVCYAVMQGHFFPELFKSYFHDIFKKHSHVDAKRSLSNISSVAARFGHLELANRLRRLFQDVRMGPNGMLDELIAGGKIEQAVQMNDHLSRTQKVSEKSLYRRLLSSAITRGDLEMTLRALQRLSWLDSKDPESFYLCLLKGASHGNVGFLRLAYVNLFQQNRPLFEICLPQMIQNIFLNYDMRETSNHWECLIYLKEIGFLRPTLLHSIPKWAIVPALNWMEENNIRFNPLHALEDYLIGKSDPQVVEWALARRMPITINGLWAIAQTDQMELFHFLWEKKEQTLDFSPSIFRQIVKAINEYLTQPLFLPHASDLTLIQRRVRLLPLQRSLKLLREKGCEWGPSHEAYNQLALCLYRRNPQQAKDFVREVQMPVERSFLIAQGISADEFGEVSPS